MATWTYISVSQMLIWTDSNILLVPSLFNEQLYEMCSFLKYDYLFIVYLLPLITDYDLGINPVLKFFSISWHLGVLLILGRGRLPGWANYYREQTTQRRACFSNANQPVQSLHSNPPPHQTLTLGGQVPDDGTAPRPKALYYSII